ncbi:MAG TPA: hypothetical protein VNH64_03940, partial [Parvularculaceae bacterium]|nr:hypothetical protein [Parvularculaceae bacterium]
MNFRSAVALLLSALALGLANFARASEDEHPRHVDYSRVTAPPAPVYQDISAVEKKSAGCMSCHSASD